MLADLQFINTIGFFDVATFQLNGTVNLHMMEVHTKFPKRNVWAGIINNQIIDSYCFEGVFNGDVYLDFL